MGFAGFDGTRVMKRWIEEEFHYIMSKRDVGISDIEEERRIRRELQIPEFSGRNVGDWILQLEDFFHFFWLNEQEKLKVAVLALEQEVMWWFEWEHRRRPFYEWSDLKHALERHFGCLPTSHWGKKFTPVSFANKTGNQMLRVSHEGGAPTQTAACGDTFGSGSLSGDFCVSNYHGMKGYYDGELQKNQVRVVKVAETTAPISKVFDGKRNGPNERKGVSWIKDSSKSGNYGGFGGGDCLNGKGNMKKPASNEEREDKAMVVRCGPDGDGLGDVVRSGGAGGCSNFVAQNLILDGGTTTCSDEVRGRGGGGFMEGGSDASGSGGGSGVLAGAAAALTGAAAALVGVNGRGGIMEKHCLEDDWSVGTIECFDYMCGLGNKPILEVSSKGKTVNVLPKQMVAATMVGSNSMDQCKTSGILDGEKAVMRLIYFHPYMGMNSFGLPHKRPISISSALISQFPVFQPKYQFDLFPSNSSKPNDYHADSQPYTPTKDLKLHFMAPPCSFSTQPNAVRGLINEDLERQWKPGIQMAKEATSHCYPSQAPTTNLYPRFTVPFSLHHHSHTLPSHAHDVRSNARHWSANFFPP